MTCSLFWDIVAKVALIASIVTGVGAIILTIYLSRQETKIKNFNELLDKNNIIIERFNDLVEKNTSVVKLLTQQNDEELRKKKLERKSNFTRVAHVRYAFHELFAKHRIDTQYKELIIAERVRWVGDVMILLERELYNPYLIEIDDLYKKWLTVHMTGKLVLFMDSIRFEEGPEVKQQYQESQLQEFYNAYIDLTKMMDEEMPKE